MRSFYARLAAVGTILCGLGLAGQAYADVPPGTASVSSSTKPITVYYDSGTTQAVANQMLAAAEKAWAAQVDDMGFELPQRVAGGQVGGQIEIGFDVYVAVLDMSTAYTFQVMGDNPATTRADCPTLGIVNKQYLGQGVDINDAASHLLSHASLHAIDCLEPALPVYDIVTGAVQRISGGFSEAQWLREVNAFQKYPEWSLDKVNCVDTTDAWYSFGALLYASFLEERYGKNDGHLLAEIWRGTPEDGHITSVDPEDSEIAYADVANQPTWFNAIAAYLETQDTTFDKAYGEFAVWRLLTGAYTDLIHFSGSDMLNEPTISVYHTADDLPVLAATQAKKVARYGTSYIVLDPSGLAADQRVRLSIQATGPYHWSAQGICVMAVGSTVVELTIDESLAGAASIPVGSCTAIVLAVENLSEGNYDLNWETPGDMCDNAKWKQVGEYTYSIEATDPVIVTGVAPNLLSVNTTSTVEITGTGLANGASIAVAVSGTGVTVSSVTWNSDTSWTATVVVAADAALGPRDITVTTGNGSAGTLSGALTIQASTGGCAIAGPSSAASPLWICAILVLLALARPRRRSSCGE